MTYDIFFDDDFDGRASAAVLLNFFKQRKDRVERLVPVDHYLKPAWVKPDALKRIAAKAKKGKKNPVIIVDFYYHPAAAMWFDHHPTTFLKRSWEDRFKPSATHHFAPEYASACHLVMDALAEYHGYRPPKHIRELANWLDIWDRAQFRSARQTIQLKEPALQVNAFLGHNKKAGHAVSGWLIKLLAEKGLAAAARDRRVRGAMKQIKKDVIRCIEFYKKHMEVRKKVLFIDVTGLKNQVHHRFTSFYLRPNILFVITRREEVPGVYKFSVGANPWKNERNPLHIGSLLRKYGGGGHKNVGGAEVKGEKAAHRLTEFLVTMLNNAVA